jgi:Protein of unknown function with PCYCGC motif
MILSRRNGLLVAGGAVIVLAAIYFGATKWRAAHVSDFPNPANAATLDPALYTGPAHDAYLVARTHPGLLAQLHCYCGCDRVYGHTSLLDCFRGTHSAHCGTCIGEALDAERMYKAGTPVDQIRAVLRERYGRRES